MILLAVGFCKVITHPLKRNDAKQLKKLHILRNYNDFQLHRTEYFYYLLMHLFIFISTSFSFFLSLSNRHLSHMCGVVLGWAVGLLRMQAVPQVEASALTDINCLPLPLHTGLGGIAWLLLIDTSRGWLGHTELIIHSTAQSFIPRVNRWTVHIHNLSGEMGGKWLAGR